jgi:IMP and pyridine-specific 5'-nucleotidase
MSAVGRRLPFCAFNGMFYVITPSALHKLRFSGGNDVFVDIGDKSWGVLACQRFFGGIEGSKTLHVGDQFLSAGANDFKARLACTTAWIANPSETVQLLDEIAELDEMMQRKTR